MMTNDDVIREEEAEKRCFFFFLSVIASFLFTFFPFLANGLTVLEMIPNLEQRNEISDYCDPSKRIVRSPRNINELMV